MILSLWNKYFHTQSYNLELAARQKILEKHSPSKALRMILSLCSYGANIFRLNHVKFAARQKILEKHSPSKALRVILSL